MLVKVNKEPVTTLLKLKLSLQDKIDDIEKYYNRYDEQIFYDGQTTAFNYAIDIIDEELEKLSKK